LFSDNISLLRVYLRSFAVNASFLNGKERFLNGDISFLNGYMLLLCGDGRLLRVVERMLKAALFVLGPWQRLRLFDTPPSPS